MGASETVLVVDDTPQHRYAVARQLKHGGFDVLEAATAAEALDLLEKKPALIVLDVHLPDISGYDLCRRIKADKVSSSIPIIQTSASFISSENKAEGLESGADSYLAQPFSGAELIATVRSLLKVRKAEAEREKVLDELQEVVAALRNSEAASRRRLAELESLYSTAPVGLSLLSPELRYLRVNEAMSRITQVPVENMLGHSVGEVAPDVYPTIAPVLKRVLEGGRPSTDIELTRSDPEQADRKRHFLARYHPIRSIDDGRVEAINAVVVETTEMKQIEHALRQSEERLRLALDSANLATWYYDPVRNVIWGDQRIQEFFTLSHAEEPPEDWVDAIHPDDRQHVYEAFQKAVSGTALYDVEYRLQRNGEVRWAHATGRLFDRQDQLPILLGTLEDITARKKAEQEVREKNQLVEIAEIGARAGFWTYRPSTNEAYLSPGTQRLFGLEGDAHPNMSELMEHIHPEDRDRVLKNLELSAESGRYSAEFRVIRPEGGFRWLMGQARLVESPESDPYLVGVNLEITAQKQTEEALRRSEKLAAVGRLASSISHEINNPLAAITNLLFLIRMNAESADIQSLAETAEHEIQRISHITTHALRFHRQTTQPAPQILSTLLESAASIHAGRIRHYEITVVRDYHDEKPVTCLDGELRQVFANLIGNAVDATRLGKIILRTRAARHPSSGAEGVRVTVADSGSGMSEEVFRHIWEPFFTTKGNQGTGLGLWISAEILERHHASVRVRSCTTPDRSGTVFSIFFPTAARIELPKSEV